MKTMNQLSADVLLGIHNALGKVAPNLRHHIHAIIRRGPSANLLPSIGRCVYQRHLVESSNTDADAILKSVRKIAHEQGCGVTFSERRLNFLAVEWRRYVDHLQAHTEVVKLTARQLAMRFSGAFAAAVLLVGCEKPASVPMNPVRWEYNTHTVYESDQSGEIITGLNKYGKDGWEVCGTFLHEERSKNLGIEITLKLKIILLKRPVP